MDRNGKMMKKIRFLKKLFVLTILQLSFFFIPAWGQESVRDFDGNTYKTVTIGTQVWLAENLRTTHYLNGEPISEIRDDSTWAGMTTGAFCVNDNDNNNSGIYGYLYNWYSVHNPAKLCPSGWHVPSANDWKKLETFLGGPGSAGGKLKAAGTDKWIGPNTDATDAGGFSALPGGSRNSDGSFNIIGETGHWWTATEFAPTTAWHRQLYNNAGFIDNVYGLKNEGFSVRCLKD